MTSSIILVGAGKGERFGQPKLLVQLAGKTLLQWNLETIQGLDFDPQIVVVVAPEQVELVSSQVDGDVQVVAGGAQRSESVQNGLAVCDGDIVLIHNIANPLASRRDYQQLYELLKGDDCAAFVGQPVVDTLRKMTPESAETVGREHMWRVQTPQAFRRQTLLRCFSKGVAEQATDEVSLFENSQTPIKALPTSSFNQKVTFPEDLEMLEQVLGNEVLIGIGEDSHYFDDSGTMMLGGIAVEGLPKLHGNSDGDVVLHALFNAISSALGRRSIGPTADPMAEQGIVDSSEYLKVVLKYAQEQGYRPQNISMSLEGKTPKIEPLVDPIKLRLSDILGIDAQHIGITATTGEGLSAYGKGEGLHCTAVVSIVRPPQR